jgi:hypothetical protein
MPLVIDLYAGLGGWAEGLLAEGWDVIGFDIERHVYGEHRYPAQLVLQDVLTLHGSQFRNADLIVASPPCQMYSYMAMPWKRAKAKATAIRADETGQMLADLNRLFEACFRIGAQASLAAGRHVPLIVENVRGAQPWVGRARWNYGSFYLWGDVPALMPPIRHGVTLRAAFSHQPNGSTIWQAYREREARKVAGIDFNAKRDTGATSPGFNVTAAQRYRMGLTETAEGVKHRGSGAVWFDTGPASQSSKSDSRKAASATIAKIPLALSRHIAAVYRP